METPFSGTDLSRAFDGGAKARFDDMVKECGELMKHDDSYEAYKFLYYYAEKNGLETEELTKKLNW